MIVIISISITSAITTTVTLYKGRKNQSVEGAGVIFVKGAGIRI